MADLESAVICGILDARKKYGVDLHEHDIACLARAVTSSIKSDAAKEVPGPTVERLKQLEAALQFAIDGWDNQDINHSTYRVEVFKAATSALSSQLSGGENG